MALLKRLLRRRNAAGHPDTNAASKLPRLKVVLMSATLDAGLYSAYFGGCPGEFLFV
jgi:HrpA-like RNA helicase